MTGREEEGKRKGRKARERERMKTKKNEARDNEKEGRIQLQNKETI